MIHLCNILSLSIHNLTFLATRLSLNLKGIPYKTIWVEYPDIAKVCKEIGAAPTGINDDGDIYYTLPVIYDPATKSAISDSRAIAEYLDATYPSTHVLLPKNTYALQAAFGSAFAEALKGIFDFALPDSLAILNPPSAQYFRSTRERWYGKKMEDFKPTGDKRKEQWADVEKGFERIDGWLKKNGEGKPYVMGDTITWADIFIVAFLLWFKTVLGEAEWEGYIELERRSVGCIHPRLRGQGLHHFQLTSSLSIS